MTPSPTEADGRKALRDLVIDRALAARERYGDLGALRAAVTARRHSGAGGSGEERCWR
jgi:hypothetical protein